jgi:hypothetical protein
MKGRRGFGHLIAIGQVGCIHSFTRYSANISS